jgi:Helicase HerA, central domain
VADLSAIYEKLGKFYLGREFDCQNRKLLDDLVLYDSKDLVTHAVIVGMTGSGKTGLGITLLEEAAIDGLPALIVDPKGDLTNLLLNFPDLDPREFLPWVNADDAAREGKSVEVFAAHQAEAWRQGLADWQQDPSRIAKITQHCELNIFTPGSDAGIPISILSSFDAPPAQIQEDADLMHDRIASTVTSLLALLGITADPIRSREHILLSTLLNHFWRNGQGLDLGILIRAIQSPPFARVGVLDLESFYPAKERFDLAMAMNNLLAAPGFSSWMSGEPLDVDRLLYSPAGKPRISIFYIAHLPENERMFFTSLLLNQTIAWMRSRPGTTSLRALLYIDELFGFMPPIAEPPTKKPLLTLMKQARAYGLGLVLATQNPVDLDYKGLSNAGTWFLGRLQTDRDKQRVLDGLEGVAGESGERFERSTISDLLSDLGKRVFLLHNVHESAPLTFQTRWALSYLAGPMTRSQIKTVMAPRKERFLRDSAAKPGRVPAIHNDELAPETASQEEFDRSAREATGSQLPNSNRPVLPPGLPETFLRVASGTPLQSPIQYEPHLLAFAKIHFCDARKGLNADESLALVTPISSDSFSLDWNAAEARELTPSDTDRDPHPGARFLSLPQEACSPKSYATWKKSLAEFLYRTRRFELFACKDLEEVSQPGEDERDFRLRLGDRIRKERDHVVEALRDKYEAKITSLEERVRKAEQKVEKEKTEASQARMNSVISLGASILSTVLGRRRIGVGNVGRAGTAVRGMGRASRADDDVRRASDDLYTFEQKLEELEEELKHEVAAIERAYDPLTIPLQNVTLKPRKADVDVQQLFLAWVPKPV